MTADTLTPAQAVRAEAMRLAIACAAHVLPPGATFADLQVLAEEIEAWLHEAKVPMIVRADRIPPPPPDWTAGTPVGAGHA